MEPSSTISIAKIQPQEPEDPKEGDCLFHSQLWVYENPLYFIDVSGIHKNLISSKFAKKLKLPIVPHPQLYTIGWMTQGQDIHVIQPCHLSYDIKPLYIYIKKERKENSTIF